MRAARDFFAASTRISRALWAVPGGVLEQVRQYLCHENGVDLERREVRRHGAAQPGRVDGAFDEGGRFVDEVVHRDELALWSKRSGFEPPQVEHRADEAGQAVGLFLDRLEQIRTRRLTQSEPWLAEIGHGHLDGGEWRAQIVGNRAHERRTPFVDLFEEVGPQRLVAQPGPLDGQCGMVGVDHEKAAIVDVEGAAVQDEEPDGTPRSGEGESAAARRRRRSFRSASPACPPTA